MRAADFIVEILKTEGVPFVAGFPGDDLLPLWDAIYNCTEMPLIVTRHEQATVFMADGYARSSGEPGVAVVTNGPGRTNALTAILNAYSDSVPLVVLFGHTSFKFLGKGMLQEKPYLDSFAPYAKWTFSIPSPDRVPDAFRRAFTIARSGRPGPVILEIPEDILTAEMEKTPYTKTRRVRFGPDLGDVDRALDLMRESQHPLVYAGRGALYSGATDELKSFVETYSVPFMTSLMAKGTIPEDHPLCLGLGGYPQAIYSTSLAKRYAEEADLVLALGCSFPQLATSNFLPKPPKGRLIQVDVDPAELQKNYIAELTVLSDVKLLLQALMRKAPERVGQWRKGMEKTVIAEVGDSKKQWLDSWKPRLTSEEVPMNPFRASWELSHLLDRRNTILLHDAGTTRAYISHHYETLFPLGFLGFGNTSSMGWSTPAALGVKLGHPEKTVVNVTGDGSFGMTGMEIETAARNGIRTLTVIFNNQCLNATRDRQRARFGNREIGIFLGGDYAGLARSLGANGERVERPGDLQGAIARALKHSGPSVLEIMVKPLEPRP